MPDVPGIAMDRRLDRVQRRCALSHELAHIDLGDHHCSGASPDGPRQGRRRERVADELAAERLLPLDRLAEVLRWALGPEEVAHELDVTPHMVRVRVRALTDAEKLWIDGQMARLEETA